MTTRIEPSKTVFPLFAALLAFVSAVLASGCGALTPKMPKIPFAEKKPDDYGVLFSVGGEVTEIRASANWKYLAVLSDDSIRRRIDLFNTEFQVPTPLAESDLADIRSPSSAVFNAKGDELFIVKKSSDGGLNVRQIPLEDRRKKAEPILPSESGRSEILLSPAADWLAVQNSKGTWELIDRDEPERVVVFPEGGENNPEKKRFSPPSKINIVRPLAFSPAGDMVATLAVLPDAPAGARKKIVLWDLSVVHSVPLDQVSERPLSAIYVAEFAVPEMVGDGLCVFSPDGRMLALRHKSKYVAIRQTADGRLLSEFGEHKQEISSLTFSPSNTKLAVGTRGEYGRIVLWEVRKGKILRTIDDPDPASRGVTAAAFSPDGKIVWYGNDRGDVKEWLTQKKIEPKKD